MEEKMVVEEKKMEVEVVEDQTHLGDADDDLK